MAINEIPEGSARISFVARVPLHLLLIFLAPLLYKTRVIPLLSCSDSHGLLPARQGKLHRGMQEEQRAYRVHHVAESQEDP
jgi:hypothetical protein